MSVFVIFVCILFVFLGMYIGKKKNLKYFSINSIFGLFFVNCLCSILKSGASLLNYNFHDTTFLYVFLCIIIGILFMMVADYKLDSCDDIAILCFCIVNSFILGCKFNLLLLIVNIIYYVIVGIYIKNSKSWIFVVIGSLIGFIFSLINSWWLGYFISSFVGVIACFIYSISIVVFKNCNKNSYIGLLIGIMIALIGGVL